MRSVVVTLYDSCQCRLASLGKSIEHILVLSCVVQGKAREITLADGTVANPCEYRGEEAVLIVFCHGSLALDGTNHFANSLGAEIIDPDVGALVNLEDAILTVFCFETVLRIPGEPTVKTYLKQGQSSELNHEPFRQDTYQHPRHVSAQSQ